MSEAVQRYMVHQFRGPARDTLAAQHPRAVASATDAIFRPVAQYPDLSDEVYCQVLLQLFRTQRTKRACELLWLCAAHVTPTRVWAATFRAVLDELSAHPTLRKELAARQVGACGWVFPVRPTRACVITIVVTRN